jgi:Asp-tRNA(Asn)/Glu-tRNA(Gln) amidotransferase B subunit
MDIQINNLTELIALIKRNDITTEQANEIVCKALRVIVLFRETKAKLIEETEYYIETYMKNAISERPIFLHKLELD